MDGSGGQTLASSPSNQMEVAASSTATWPVVHGAVGSCLCFESSLCPLEQSSTPLILQRPSSPHSAPCDITIAFPQKHEIRQIYVRSTARIYEIYYAPVPATPNEYLSTVRCSPVQLSPDDADDNETSRSSNTSTSEDGWVDILNSNVSNINLTPPRTREDLYEATAEISDADPCISLTLRLLSIQSKGYVYVDEIYVFGDPVDDDDAEDPKNPAGNPAGTSLMAMLAPTLLQLQLSKSGTSRSPYDNRNSNERTDQNSREFGSQGADSTFATYENLSQVRPSVSSQLGATSHTVAATAKAAEPERSHASVGSSDEMMNPNSYGKEDPRHIEQALNELLSRVIKIEQTCSRFEENMRKPICSIEERLSRVEQQLSLLTKNPQNSKVSSGTRYSAPDWSCVESASNSSDADESNPVYGTSHGHDSPAVALPPLPSGSGNGSPVLVDGNKVLPSLLFSAPQCTNHDPEESDPPVPVAEASPVQPKKSVSIDDALASALAAFISPTHPQTLTKAFLIKAPDFSTSEESENSNTQASVNHISLITSSISQEDDSASTSSSVLHEVLLDNGTSSDQIEEHNEGSSSPKFEGNSQFMNDDDSQVDERNDGISSDKFQGDVQYVSNEDAPDVSSRRCSDSANIEQTSEEDAHSNNSVFLQLGAHGGDHQQKVGKGKEALNQEALLQVVELAHMPRPVDFDSSVLDVTFVSGDIPTTKSSSLEALFKDMTAGYEVEASDVPELVSVNYATTDHDLISVENEETGSHATSDFTVNMHHYELETTTVALENKLKENEGREDLHSHCSHEVFPASLI
uniref:Uncharacterized protein n=1 Tax=Kalanchoe fedtschenkoi TaxID=63787 RepID=A0A7N0T3B0_KALFE